MVGEVHQMGRRCRADGRKHDIDRLGIGAHAKRLQHDQLWHPVLRLNIIDPIPPVWNGYAEATL